MKQVITSTIFFVIASTTLFCQSVKTSFKTFADTSFKVGDIILAPKIYFALSSCEFLPESKDSVDVIADFARRHPKFKLEIGVHTDTRGKKESNIKLAECRALSLLNYLTKPAGLPADNFSIKGYGATKPLISDETIKKVNVRKESPEAVERLHDKNRRVEIKVLRTM